MRLYVGEDVGYGNNIVQDCLVEKRAVREGYLLTVMGSFFDH